MQGMKSQNYTKDGRTLKSCQLGPFMIGTVRPLNSEAQPKTKKPDLLSHIPFI